MASVRSPYVPAQAANLDDLEKGRIANDFAEGIIRQGFVRKVFGLLACQLALTVIVGGTIVTNAGVKSLVLGNSLVLLLSFAMSLGPIIYMSFSEKARHQFPKNVILMSIFTVGEGILVGACTARYNTDIVLLALGMTAAITASLCMYALTTKTDFTGMGSYLWVGLLSLLVAGLVGVVLRTPLFTLAMSAGGAVLFSMYILYDVQMLMGGQHQCRVSPDEYVFAAINIYLDIINLFLYILRILNEARDRS